VSEKSPQSGYPPGDKVEAALLPQLGSDRALYRRLPAMRSRSFRLFWFGQLVSLTGTWVQSVAQQWLVLELTGSAFKLGLVTTVQFTPLLLLSLVAGAVSDRLPKRNLLLVTQVISGALAVILGVLVQTGQVRFWHVLVLAGLLGTANAFYTPARQSFVPELVDRESLANAVALNSAIFNAARVVGPAVGGLLIASIGLSLNFYLNAASYLAVIASLLLINPRPPSGAAGRINLWNTMKEGLVYIAAVPTVATILALVGVASFFGLNFTTLLPVYARGVLHVGSAGYGFLAAAMGLGSLVGAVSLAFFGRGGHVRRLIYTGAITFTIAEIMLSFSRVYGVSVVLLLILGVNMTLFTTTANTQILSQTPAELQGRVMSVYSLMFLGMTPFGSFLAGVVADRWGAPVAILAGGVITLAFTLFVFFYRPTRHMKRFREVHKDPAG
jgi:MFS family permease